MAFEFDPTTARPEGEAAPQFDPATAAPAKEATLGERVSFGARRMVNSARTTLTDDPSKIAQIAADQAKAAPAQSAASRQMQEEIKPYADAANNATGVVDTVKTWGALGAKRAGQLISNPGETVKMIAEQLPNSVPGLAGAVAGAKAGAMAGTAVAPGVGTAIGAVGGGVLGGLAGGYLTEKGASVQEQVQTKAAERGIDLQDQQAVAGVFRSNQAEIDKAATLKAVGTAGTDAVLNVLTAGLSGMGRRILGNEVATMAEAVKAGRVTAAEGAKQLASLEARAVAQSALPATVARGAAVTGAEMLGEGVSEAVGQKLAYGKVDAGDVVDESLLGLGQGVAMAGASSAVNRIAGTPDRDQIQQNIASLRERLLAGQDAAPAQGAAADPLMLPNSQPDRLYVFPDGTVGRTGEVESYLANLPEDQREEARLSLMGRNYTEVNDPQAQQARRWWENYSETTQDVRTYGPLIEKVVQPELQQEYREALARALDERLSRGDREAAASALHRAFNPEVAESPVRFPPTPDYLAEVQAAVRHGTPFTTQQTVDTVRSAMEDAWLAQNVTPDAPAAAASAEVVGEQLQGEFEQVGGDTALAAVDARVRTGRVLAGLQNILDGGADNTLQVLSRLNTSLTRIDEQPLTGEEASRVRRIVDAYMGFRGVGEPAPLPALPPPAVDPFADNAAMEAFIPERPSRAMGLDPSAGALSAAAVTAVDGGLSQALAQRRAQAQAQQLAEAQAKAGGKSQAQPQQSVTGASGAELLTNQTSTMAGANPLRDAILRIRSEKANANPQAQALQTQSAQADAARDQASAPVGSNGAAAPGLPGAGDPATTSPGLTPTAFPASTQEAQTDGPQAAQAQQATSQQRAPQSPATAVGAEVAAVANQAATSDLNDLPQPTQAQKEAGNYKKAHLKFDGLDLTVENPVGSTRSGIDPNGKPWQVTMTAHYGYHKRTMGADGDQVDVYLANDPKPGSPVFVFDQFNADGTFDEHKAVAGVGTQAEAEAIYDAHFSDGSGPRRRRGVTAMPVAEFKTWAASEEAAKGPLQRQASAQPKQQPRDNPARRMRLNAWQTNPMRAFLGEHGIHSDLAAEFAPGAAERRKAMVPGFGPIFRRSGKQLDELATLARDAGFTLDDDVAELYPLIERAIRGERIAPLYAEGVAEREMERAAQARYEDFVEQAQAEQVDDPLAPLLDDGFTEADIAAAGLGTASPDLIAQVQALHAQLEAAGLDPEDMLERFALQFPDLSEEQFNEQLQNAYQQALADAAQSRSIQDAGGPADRQAGAPGQRGQDGALQTGGDLLTSPTRADIEAQQDRAEAAARQEATDQQRAEQDAAIARERAEVARRSQAAADTFELGQDPMANLTGQQDIFGAAQPAAAAPAPAVIEDLGEKIGGARKDTARSTGTRSAKKDDDRPAWARRFQISQVVKAGGRDAQEEGRWVISDTRNTDWMKQPKQVGRSFATREEAEAAVPLAAVSLKHRVVPSREGQWEIWRNITDRKRVKVVDQTFTSREEAMAYMAQNAVAILETSTTFGEADLPLSTDLERVGSARRTGDVAGQDFMEAFGFRGVEFGNWNNQAERQQVMNAAYDGLLDLAEVLNLPPKAISLNGDLALAFGARGHGLSGARAHYEPGKAVINLTKMNGAGALAHEWLHALDHYFGRQDGKASSTWETDADGTRSLKGAGVGDMATEGTRGERSGMRAEIRAALRNVLEVMTRKAETYVEDTQKVDRFVGQSRDEVRSQLDRLRADLAQQLDPKYYSRKNAPATAEQLAEFDTIAEQLVQGVGLETSYRPVAGTKSLTGGRWTNDALEQLSAINKAVRGRTGFNAERAGTLDRLRGYLDRYQQRLKMLADAQVSTEKTRAVPTDFAMDARSLDQGRGTDYWTTLPEMAARAFQGYVEDKISGKGGKSPFLNHAPENAGILTPWGWKRPFPAGEERKAINAAFDKLVGEFKTRETEQGTAIFSRPMDMETLQRMFKPLAPLSVTETQAAVAEMVKGWRNGPRLRVVATPNELPSPAPADTRGQYLNGTAYLVASNHRSAGNVQRTLAHEAIAHYGLNAMLGDLEWRRAMVNIQQGLERGDAALLEMRDQVRFAYRDAAGNFMLSPQQEADEIAARAVEVGFDAKTGEFRTGFEWVKRAYSRIAQFLRNLGFDVRFTNAELQGMLARAQRFLATPARKDESLVLGGTEPTPQLARDRATGLDTAIIGNALGAANSHPRYAEAKAGNLSAALDLARDLITPDVVAKVRAAIGDSKPLIVPVVAEEAAGRNKIPLATAEVLAQKLNLETVDDIAQANRPKRTGLDGLDRIFARVEFDGPVQAGQDYLLLDDTLTQGGTFAALASHIEAGGGRVVGAFALTGKQYSAKIALSPDTLQALRDKHGSIESDFQAATGYGFDALTESEARYLANFRPADAVRARISEAGRTASQGGNPPPAGPDGVSGAALARGAGQWDTPASSRFDNLVYKLQDKLIDVKRVQEAITATAGQIGDDLNAYLQEELFHGRAASRVKDFASRELKPLLTQMRTLGLQMSDVEEFLHARHAREANALIAGREPNMPDGGSGMTNQAADDYFRNLDPAQRRRLEQVAGKVDAIIASTRQLYADYGLEDQATVDGWGQMFKSYVPLMREDKDGGMGVGQGFSIKGKEVKGRTGSARKVVDILANVAAQRERVIVRGEKNRVARALLGLAHVNPNPQFWEVRSQPPTERVYDAARDMVVERPDSMFKQRPNVITAKVRDIRGNVTEQAVVLNEDNPRAVRMAQALKNLDAGNLEGLLGASATITRYFAAINTQYNPVFGVVNLVRDVQAAMVNLAATPLAGQQRRIATDTAAALAAIYRDVRATRRGGRATSAWSTLWEQMQADGGTTGYRDLFRTSADRAEQMQSILTPEGWMNTGWGRFITADGRLKVPAAMVQKQAGMLFDWLSDYNEAMENGVRLATYKAALDNGMSREQAASMAKNLTVNFNRRGQVGLQAGALYAFFNAAMQGTARIGQTIFDMDNGNPKTLRLSSVGKKVVYGGVLLGSIQALMLAAAGFGDDDPPEFVRERSLIIPTGGKTYISIPMPLGLHVIPGLGRHATEFALSGFEKPAHRVQSLVAMFADAFNPIGNAGLSIQTLAPTALDPLVALSENRDWTGKPIARVSSNKALPGHAQWKDTATTWSKLIAEGINSISGGNEYVAGVLSPTPDQIDYLIAQLTGGVGRELSKVEQSARSLITGEELPTYKVPLIGRLVGNADSQASQGNAFYANLNRINEVETEIKGLRKDGRSVDAARLMRERPEARLIQMANRTERRVQELRREKRALVEKGADREAVRAKDAQVTAEMTRLNLAVERARETAR